MGNKGYCPIKFFASYQEKLGLGPINGIHISAEV